MRSVVSLNKIGRASGSQRLPADGVVKIVGGGAAHDTALSLSRILGLVENRAGGPSSRYLARAELLSQPRSKRERAKT